MTYSKKELTYPQAFLLVSAIVIVGLSLVVCMGKLSTKDLPPYVESSIHYDGINKQTFCEKYIMITSVRMRYRMETITLDTEGDLGSKEELELLQPERLQQAEEVRKHYQERWDNRECK